MTESNKIAKTFNSLFETVTDSLNLFSWSSKVNVCDDKVKGITLNFSNHPSILKIKEFGTSNDRFSTTCKLSYIKQTIKNHRLNLRLKKLT